MVFGKPKSFVAQDFRVPCERARVVETFFSGSALSQMRQVQDGKRRIGKTRAIRHECPVPPLVNHLVRKRLLLFDAPDVRLVQGVRNGENYESLGGKQGHWKMRSKAGT